MNKLLLSFLIPFCLQFTPAKAQWVTIPDTNFVAFLNLNYPSCMNGNLMDTTCAEIINETSIAFNLNFPNISGIQYFDNLIALNCVGGQIVSLPTLPNSLTHLDCSNNQLNSLPNLPGNLVTLICYKNQITSLPILPNSLKTLKCGDDYFQNDGQVYGNQLTILPNLPNTLTYLDVSANDITNLTSLPDSLTTLICSFNQLDSLPVLPSTITTLICRNNLINNLPVLPNSLQILGCGNNQLTNLPFLPNTITELKCYQNQLVNLPNLPSNLTRINCLDNFLNSLPAIPNSLIELNCTDNQLTSLPILPSNLVSLNCGYNQITNINVPFNHFNNLNVLSCNNNQLTNIPSVPNQMYAYNISFNNISCLINLPYGTWAPYCDISNNPLTCVPNQTDYTIGLPLCIDNDPIYNPNNCPGVNITGSVFTDLFPNCVYDNYDYHIENVPVKLYDNLNNFLSLSYTVNGVYSFASLLPDSFKVVIDDNSLPFSLDCSQPNNQSIVLDSANQTISNINFPVVCDTAYDINLHSINQYGWVFPGQMHTLQSNISTNINWYNLNCSTNYFGTVSFNVTGPVTYISPASGALNPTVNGNTCTYNISDFNNLNANSFGLQFKTDSTAQASDQICVHVEINPTPLDGDTTNNVYDFCYQVVNSYDPNMKEVYPVNVLPGYDDWFTYTIHFQNTGNAPAFNIRLRDTLDANLDINSFEVRGYSHPAQISINGNILTVRFNNIMLPDSTTDYEGSMGYFQYRLKPLPNLPNGTQIENTAYIYFDYNAPIITNTTQNNFVMPVKTNNPLQQASQLSLYPNPSNGIFTFNESKNIKTVEVYNMMGELVVTQGNAKQINLQGYPKGVYVARVNGTQVCRLVKD